MASKLRRTPLFGYDGNLGIPIMPPQPSSQRTSTKSKSSSVSVLSSTSSLCCKKTSGVMEVVSSRSVYGEAATNSAGNSSAAEVSPRLQENTESSTSNTSFSEVDVSSRRIMASKYATSARTGRSGAQVSQSTPPPHTPNKQVNFGSGNGGEEKKREKFLTAKYGAHQMALIRKRLRVEMWMYEKLAEIYGDDDIEIDLDEVLDMEDEGDRRTYIYELLRLETNNGRRNNKNSNSVEVFVGDLLEKVKTL